MYDSVLFRKHKRLILYMICKVYFSQKEIIEYSIGNGEFRNKTSWVCKNQYRDKLISLGYLKKYSRREFFNQFSIYPDIINSARQEYTGPHERNQAYLAFNNLKILDMIALPLPADKELKDSFRKYVFYKHAKFKEGPSEFFKAAESLAKILQDKRTMIYLGSTEKDKRFYLNFLNEPLKKYANYVLNDYDETLALEEYINSFIIGCSLHRPIFSFRKNKVAEYVSKFSDKLRKYRRIKATHQMKPYISKAKEIYEKELRDYFEFLSA